MPDPPDVGELSPPDRTLMGPGPSDVHPRVLRAMATPLVGHLDPHFLELMDETQALLEYVFRTDDGLTIPVSGTGSAAMEAAIGNVVEPGDVVVAPDNGYFGQRMARMAERAGAEVVAVEAPWGEPLAVDDVDAALADAGADVLAFVHGETSTGVRQPEVPALADVANDRGALTVMDCVASLGGVEVRVDDWGIDVAYSGAQKALSVPPGASPLTVGPAAMEKVRARETAPRSWYLDLPLLSKYWGEERAYHHTAPITNVYALREGLRLVAEEGIEDCWERHERVARSLLDGLESMGLSLAPDRDAWLPTLNAVSVPDGVDAGGVVDHLLSVYDVEIAGGLGDLAGEIWRIGCMGYSARPKNVTYLLSTMADALEEQGYDVEGALAGGG